MPYKINFLLKGFLHFFHNTTPIQLVLPHNISPILFYHTSVRKCILFCCMMSFFNQFHHIGHFVFYYTTQSQNHFIFCENCISFLRWSLSHSLFCFFGHSVLSPLLFFFANFLPKNRIRLNLYFKTPHEISYNVTHRIQHNHISFCITSRNFVFHYTTQKS